MHWIFPEFVTGRCAVGLLLLRLVTGLAFILHGWPKMQNMTGWMGPEAPVPGVAQAAAALSEFGGGIALMLGLLTPLAAVFLAGTMTVAMFMAHISQGHPFVAKEGPSYELAAVYLTIVLTLLLLGPGKLSLDALLFGRRGTTE